jgi:hydrogenase maturation protease
MGVRQVVLGVGNAIMTDDRVGIAAAEVLAQMLAARAGVAVRFSERGGLDLLDLLEGCDHAVVVDAYLVPGEEPGTVLTRSVEDFSGSHHLYAAHGVDLPTALRLGRELGADMPARVDIVGVVVQDPYTVSDRMTPAVAAAVQPAVARVLALLDAP